MNLLELDDSSENDEIFPVESASNLSAVQSQASAVSTAAPSVVSFVGFNATEIAMSGRFFSKPANQKDSAARKEKLKCNLCQCSTVQAHNYTNFVSHAKTIHLDEFESQRKSLNMANPQQSEGSSNSKTTGGVQTKLSFSNTMAYNSEHMRDCLVRWIVMDDQPFSIVDQPWFRSFCQLLNAGVTDGKQPDIPKFGNTVKKWILDLYEVERAKIVHRIRNTSTKISYTTDLWTSPAQVSFMAITAHWIDDSWTMQSATLDFIPVQGHHTGVALAKHFMDTIDAFGLKDCSLGVTLDAAANNATMTDEMEKKGYLKIGHHFNCFAHALNLACKDGLLEIVDGVQSLRTCVKALHYSNIKLQRLEKECKAMDVKFLKPVLDVDTRWNSTYDMLFWAKRVQLPLRNVLKEFHEESLSSRGDKIPLVTDFDWKRFDEILGFLKLFKDATIVANGQNYATMSYVVLLYNVLLDSIEDHRKRYCESISDIHRLTKVRDSRTSTNAEKHDAAIKLLEYFDEQLYNDLISAADAVTDKLGHYYNITPDACDISCALDPRYMAEYYGKDAIDKVEQSEKISVVQNRVQAIFNQEYQTPESVETLLPDSAASGDNDLEN